MNRYQKILWPLALLAVLLFLTCRQIIDLDIFYHLANGESILQTGTIPRSNLFIFTECPDFYPNPSWLFGVFAALLHRLGGIPALILVKAVMVVLTFALLLGALRRQGVSWGLATGWLWLIAMASTFRFNERPHLFSHLFLLLFVLLLLKHREEGGRAIFWLIPLTALWANLHAGFLLGLVFVAVFLCGEFVTFLWQRRRSSNEETLAAPRLRLLSLVLGTSILASLLTPTPLAPYRMLFASSSIGEAFSITEYLPSTPSDHPWFYLFVVLLLLLQLWPPRRLDPTLLLPTGVFLLLAVASNRFIPDFMIVATLLAAAPLRRCSAFQLPAWSLWLLLSGMLVATLLLPPVGSRPGLGVDRREFPAGAVHFLKAQQGQGNLYNSMGLSGVAMFYLYPEYRLYQTSFFQVESERIIEAHQANTTPEMWTTFLDKYAIDIAFVDTTREAHSPLHYPQERWALVYFDDLSAVFLRRDGKNGAIIRNFEVVVAHPGTFQQRGRGLSGIGSEEAARAVDELRQVLSWDDENHLAHLMLANYLSTRREYDEALRHYARAIKIHPQSVQAHLQQGLLLRDTGRLAEALLSLRQVTKLQKNDPFLWNELGVVLGMQEDFPAALAAFDQALGLDPDYQPARENRDRARQLQQGR